MTCTIPEPHEPRQTHPPLPASRMPELCPEKYSLEQAKKHSSAYKLSDLTTIGVGGSIALYVEATTEAEIIEAVSYADENHLPLLVLGGASNVLPSDEDFPGMVLRIANRDFALTQIGGCEGANLRVGAGYEWDAFVAKCVSEDWMGVEALSGIPGSVGAAPVQNIGAYGQEVSTVITRVRTWDRKAHSRREFTASELKFSYRHSILKETIAHPYAPSPRYIVLSVDFQMRLASLSAPIQYAQLAHALGVQLEERAQCTAVREAVLSLRKGKGMVISQERDSYSCGSFFVNPVIAIEQAKDLPEEVPTYPVVEEEKRVLGKQPPVRSDVQKVSAAWLIQHSGFAPGFSLPGSQAALSSRHTLALTNRGGASARDIRELAHHIAEGVHRQWGITLTPEPVWIGESWQEYENKRNA